MREHPKVFISYSHQNKDYELLVFEFANKLRTEGIDATIDVYEEAPNEGWPLWMERQIESADYVLVANSKSFKEKITDINSGKGVSWEARIIYQHIYDAGGDNTKFIPIFFEEDDEQYILTPLKAYTYYNVSIDEQYDKLYWRLRGVVSNKKPPLGELRPLPQKERKTMFFSSPIDIDKWDQAGWRGIVYFFHPEMVPVLGLLFENYEVGKDIFIEWRQEIANDFADSLLSVSFVTSPFPSDCWVYSDKSRNYGKGYFVHIGSNLKADFDRIESDTGLSGEEVLLTTVSRYQWMDETPESNNRVMFQRLSLDGYIIVPIGVKDTTKTIGLDNVFFEPDKYSIRMKNVTFKRGIDLKENDFCSVVLKKP